jgi:hypothetical protein
MYHGELRVDSIRFDKDGTHYFVMDRHGNPTVDTPYFHIIEVKVRSLGTRPTFLFFFFPLLFL